MNEEHFVGEGTVYPADEVPITTTIEKMIPFTYNGKKYVRVWTIYDNLSYYQQRNDEYIKSLDAKAKQEHKDNQIKGVLAILAVIGIILSLIFL